ncbi:MAG: transcriptional regulator [Acidimicrobiaceae bacterium]|nr:transcriptional regulator [Acidimicrobiaceae bacterium]
MDASYARQVGDRLRKVRKQQRLSLQAVEAASGQEFKASVLGAYERGERAISVPRLQRLSVFYNVPVDQLLPKEGDGERGSRDPERNGTGEGGKVSIDLTALSEAHGAEADLVSRYLRMIQVQRQDFNGRVLTIREADLLALACLTDTQPENMRRKLEDLGIRR